jgi:hypothetical protein
VPLIIGDTGDQNLVGQLIAEQKVHYVIQNGRISVGTIGKVRAPKSDGKTCFVASP